MRAARDINLSLPLLRAGDVHPNPGPALRIAQFNILGFTPGRRLSLLHKAITHNLDVLLLQELHVTEDEASRLTLDGYKFFAVSRNARGGGVAVLVRDVFQSSLVSQSITSVVEQITTCVKVGAHLCYFTSAYFPSGNRVGSATVHSLSQGAWTTHPIGLDSNCHHGRWDTYADANPGGSHIVDFCTDERYAILNTGDPTRRSLTVRKGRFSAPDVTLARGCTTQRWQSTPDPDSDHFLITFNFVIGDDVPLAHHVPKRSFYSWGKANWQEFSRLVAADCRTFPMRGNPHQQAKFLSRSIAKATSKAVPKGVVRVRHFWSADIEDAQSKCEVLLNPIHGTTPAQRRAILDSTRERKKLLDMHCKNEWGKACADMKTSNSATWRMLHNIMSTRPTPTNLVVEGGREIPLTSAANHLVSFFKTKATRHPRAKVPQTPPRPTGLLRALTRHELNVALGCMSHATACGPDDVYNEALAHLPKIARVALLRTFNRSLSRGIVPREWKRGTIVPILKPGKPSGRVDSYRPVTLTSTLAKLMERILHGRLRHLVQSDNQAGFRADRSSTDALMWLRAHVQPTNASKTPLTSAVFVDFSRAFDSVDHDLLLKRLQQLDVDPYLVRWTLSFLRDRQVRARMGHRHYSRVKTFTCGVPQGTVLGPLLFNVFMDVLSADLDHSGAQHYFYADDLTIIARGRDRELVLNQALDVLDHWSRAHFMDVNVGKTKVCNFRSRSDAPVVRYRGTELAVDDAPKLLGVTFNKHRGFGHHTQTMKSKCQKSLLQLSAICNTVLGASRDAIRCFHLAMVTSYMQYACAAWFGIASATDLATLDSIQARGARLACGLLATTNTHDSLLEANLASVSETAKYLTYKTFLLSTLRGGSRADNVTRCFPPSSEIGKLHTEITEAYGPVEPLTDAPSLNPRIRIRPWTLQAVTKEMADFVKKRASDETIAHRHPADYELWTDGSYVAETSSVAGAALLFAKGIESYTTVSVCGKGRSSLRSECLALHAGLHRVIADRTLHRGQRLLVASDSQSLLMALRCHTARTTNSTFTECVEMLNGLADRGVKICLQFVFGHCGVSRNELADVASNAAHGCSTRYPLWHKDALSIARGKIATEASKKLEARESHRRRVVGLRPTKTKHLTGVRLLDCLASQARTNWSPYWGDLHRTMNPSAPKACRFCSNPPTSSSVAPPIAQSRKRGRTTDAVKCPECSIVLASRSSGVGHLRATHGYPHQEALRLLRSAPPAPPGDRTGPHKCPYCPRMFRFVPTVNRHVVEKHRDEARIRRARPAAQPATSPTPSGPCHLCSFTSRTKAGITSHLLRTHNFDRRLPKRHRSNDCEESVEHLLFHCPRFSALRIKHAIRPPADSDQWFERRIPEFLVDALQLLDDPSDCRTGELPSVTASPKKPSAEARVLSCAKFIFIFYNCKPLIITASGVVASLIGCASRCLKKRARD